MNDQNWSGMMNQLDIIRENMFVNTHAIMCVKCVIALKKKNVSSSSTLTLQLQTVQTDSAYDNCLIV